jgi:hypothetical protein
MAALLVLGTNTRTTSLVSRVRVRQRAPAPQFAAPRTGISEKLVTTNTPRYVLLA